MLTSSAPTTPMRPVPAVPPPRRPRRGLRVALALLSAVALLSTGYAWTVLRQVTGGVGTGADLAAPASPDGATDVLLIGLDSRTDSRGDPLPRAVLDRLNAGDATGTINTDTIILVRIPNAPGQPTTALSIPRDTYVPIPGFGRHKINSAYPRAAADARTRLTAQGVSGPELERRVDEAGRTELAATVQDLTGISIDHYAEVNLAGFAEVTDAVGGVSVCLNAPAHDPFAGTDIPAGPQTLDGPAALSFVRQRHGLPRGDLDRIVRQQAFLAALAHQVLSAGTLLDPAALGRLTEAVSRYIVVDQGWDLLGFASHASALTGGDIGFETIPTLRDDLHTPSDGDAVEVDGAAVRRFVAALVGQGQPDPAPTSPLVVDIRNGTTRTGLAADVARALSARGMTTGTVDTTAPTRRTSVHVAAGTDATAVAAALGGAPVVVDPTVQAGHVRVVLGRLGSTVPDGGGAPPGPVAPPPAPAFTAAGVPCVN